MSDDCSLSIIIATYNRPDQLRRLLSSLDKCGISEQKDIETIVVDQSDSPVEISSSSNLKHIKTCPEHKGASRARNRGLTEARGRYSWFLDDDCIVTSIKLQELRASNAPLLFANWNERSNYLPILSRLPTIGTDLFLLRSSGTPFFLTKTSLVRMIGGFNEDVGPGKRIIAGEDLDLILKIKKTCKRITPKIVASVSHDLGNHDPIRSRNYAYSRGYILAINSQYDLVLLDACYSLLTLGKTSGLSRLAYMLYGFANGYWHLFKKF